MHSQTTAHRAGQVPLRQSADESAHSTSRQRAWTPLALLALVFVQLCSAIVAAPLDLPLRSRAEKAKDAWEIVEQRGHWDAAKTAVVICDMWDTHTCPNSAAR